MEYPHQRRADSSALPIGSRETKSLTCFDNMNEARDTVIKKCLSLANTALAGKWTFHNSNEALLWFRSILEIDPENSDARLGSAQVYQYIASQPWWHNDLRLVKKA